MALTKATASSFSAVGIMALTSCHRVTTVMSMYGSVNVEFKFVVCSKGSNDSLYTLHMSSCSEPHQPWLYPSSFVEGDGHVGIVSNAPFGTHRRNRKIAAQAVRWPAPRIYI